MCSSDLAELKTVRHFVLMTDRAHMPASTTVPNLLCYEELVDAEDGDYRWPEFDENTACTICYTSGKTMKTVTAVNPKCPAGYKKK